MFAVVNDRGIANCGVGASCLKGGEPWERAVFPGGTRVVRNRKSNVRCTAPGNAPYLKGSDDRLPERETARFDFSRVLAGGVGESVCTQLHQRDGRRRKG